MTNFGSRKKTGWILHASDLRSQVGNMFGRDDESVFELYSTDSEIS